MPSHRPPTRHLTHREKRARMEAWLRRADEVLDEYGEPKEVTPDGPPPQDAA